MTKQPHLMHVDELFGSPLDAGIALRNWDPELTRQVSVDLSGAATILAPSEELSFAGEEYRIVRAKIARLLERPFRIAITSPSVGDGKTRSALNLAAALALAGESRTLLVDADLRRSNVHLNLRVPASPGLSEVLNGQRSIQEAIFQTKELSRLFVLTGGEKADKISELLHSKRWKVLASELTAYFDQIVLDCPPVDLFADFDLIASVCDAVVLVVRPDHTDRVLLSAALKKLPPKLLGVLVNAVEDSLLNPNSSHRYHDYYRKSVR